MSLLLHHSSAAGVERKPEPAAFHYDLPEPTEPSRTETTIHTDDPQYRLTSTAYFPPALLEPSLGLQNNQSRHPDPTPGRWLDEDPVGYDGNDDNLHRYVG